jgi:hypothetical protein
LHVLIEVPTLGIEDLIDPASVPSKPGRPAVPMRITTLRRRSPKRRVWVALLMLSEIQSDKSTPRDTWRRIPILSNSNDSATSLLATENWQEFSWHSYIWRASSSGCSAISSLALDRYSGVSA